MPDMILSDMIKKVSDPGWIANREAKKSLSGTALREHWNFECTAPGTTADEFATAVELEIRKFVRNAWLSCIGVQDEKPSTDDYAFVYTVVYHACTIKSPLNWVGRGYAFYRKLMREYALPPGQERDKFIKSATHLFKYMDRFYVKRLSLPPLADSAVTVMDHALKADEAAWRRLRLRAAFRHWGYDQAVWADAYGEGGVYHERELKWWGANGPQ